MMLAIDVFILLISLAVFSKVTVLYALIIQFTYSKVISFVLFGGNMRIVKMVIISKNVEAIKQLLDDELEVGYSLDYVVNKKGEVMERIIIRTTFLRCSPNPRTSTTSGSQCIY